MTILFVLALLMIFYLCIYILKMNRELHNISSQILEEKKIININLFNKSINSLVNLINKKEQRDREEMIKSEDRLSEIEDTILDISHDIRTPITGVSGYLQLLSKTEIEDRQREYIELARGKIISLEKLVEDFYQISYVDSNEEIQIHDIGIVDFLIETLLDKSIVFERQNINLITDFPDEDIMVKGNSNLMRRIVENIIDNVGYHGKNTLKVKFEEADKYVNIVFENPMDVEDEIDVDLVFEKFYKADKSRSRESSGLGLSIVKKFMEKLNGNTTIEIRDNIFKITISLLKS